MGLFKGFRLIDSGKTEEAVGRAVKRFLAERTDVDRSDIMITTTVHPGNMYVAYKKHVAKYMPYFYSSFY